jgi:glycosyltransferase involved in cell wall biosynthesis
VKILELTQRYPPAIGGVERHVERLTQELTRAGHRVEVVTTDLGRDRPFARVRIRPPETSIPVRRHIALPLLPAPHGLGIVAPGMFLDALSTEADAVHAHAFGYPPTWAGLLRHRLQRTPLVITAHSDTGTGGWASRVYARSLTRATLRPADRVVALTELERGRLQSLGVDPERLAVIPNGIDLAEFPTARAAASHDRPFVFLYIGRLYPEQKGLATLIEAFASLPRQPGAQLRLVGEDWGGLSIVRDLARTRGVGDSVVTTGTLSRSELLRELARADVLVLPSRFEPFGIVLLEAMAAGLPIVASRVGGIPEIVLDGETGLLVPPDRPAALATALQQLRNDPALGRQLGAAGRRRVEQFSWERIAPKFLALFEELRRPS